MILSYDYVEASFRMLDMPLKSHMKIKEILRAGFFCDLTPSPPAISSAGKNFAVIEF